MRFKAIVEGYGEVEAAPELVRRLAWEAEAWNMIALPSIRAHRSDFNSQDKVERHVKLAKLDVPDAILIVFDADDDCPVEVAQQVSAWAKAAAAPTPCEVVVAAREYESWFLAAIESLRGERGLGPNANFTGEPDDVQDPKGLVSGLMESGKTYSPTADQTALTSKFDMTIAHRRSRSFRRMVSAMGALLTGAGHTIATWPPTHWGLE